MLISEMIGQSIKTRVKLHNYRYPRSGVQESGYAIVIFDVVKNLEGELPDDFISGHSDEQLEYQITAVGIMPKIERNAEYILQGTLDLDKKWGAQCKVDFIRMDYNFESQEDQYKFFSFFMTDNQIQSLFNYCDNPAALLENQDIKELTKIKGIGPATAKRMCTKYEQCKDKGQAYIKLKEFGLTKNAIDRIIAAYGSPDEAALQVNQNPYVLIKHVRGFGWLKADTAARARGFARNCKERVMAYIKYYLDVQAEQAGNIWVTIDDLILNVSNECNPIGHDILTGWIKEITASQNQFEELYAQYVKDPSIEFPLLMYNREGRKIGLSYYRLLERKIADQLQRLQEEPNQFTYDKEVCEKLIKEVEDEQGYEFTDEQHSAIYKMLDSNVSVLTGSAGCVDCDTEYFNGIKWKKISEYVSGEKVLMYNEDGSAELVVPSDYVKYPCDQLWLTQTKYGLDMCLSEEHNVYYITSKGNLYHQSFGAIKTMHEKSVSGFTGKFITSFKGGSTGIKLTDAEIKVMLAVICDGSFTRNNTNLCRFHIKKERKKVELRKIFAEANLTYREKESTADGYTDFYIYAPRREKIFTEYWYQCSHEQLYLICNNILLWDGTIVNNRQSFSTSVVKNADFIQYAFSACGYKATIKMNNRTGQKYLTNNKYYTRKSIEYTVQISKRNLVSIGGFHGDNKNKTEILPYKTKDGYKYCFTVPTHMWIMRRNGKIVVTGNTGKSSTLKPLIRILRYYNKYVSQCALAGRASSLLSEITGLEGKTIHRLLGYIPETEKFAHTATNPLKADVVILDETSMVGEELFLSLIKAIKTGSKLIMLGDIKQLPPINVGNILNDCIRSGYISANVLTQTHRQALRSGIVSQSVKVCSGESIVKNDFRGEEIRGELQDFKLISVYDLTEVQLNIIKEFRRLYFIEHVALDNIQIIIPTRVRGNNSCRVINSMIQDIVNPGFRNDSATVEYNENGFKYTVTYKPNDRIIVNRNNYHALNIDGDEVAIFNGNMGRIKSIHKDHMIIELPEQGEVILEKEDWWNIGLAYAITVHKLQGSQAPYTIVAIDSSSYALLSRELIYTALTRATKYCILITQPKMLNLGIKISAIKQKQTWLMDELFKLYIQTQERDLKADDIG